jgi:hypothetical protein
MNRSFPLVSEAVVRELDRQRALECGVRTRERFVRSQAIAKYYVRAPERRRGFANGQASGKERPLDVVQRGQRSS